jgi:hypothetical protein
MNVSTELENAVEEALMANDEALTADMRAEAQWNAQLVAGETPVQAARLILQNYAAASGGHPPVGEPLPAAELTNLVEALLADLFSGSDGQRVLDLVSWLWDDGATSARTQDPATVYLAVSLLVVADRGGADVHDLLERTRRQMEADRLVEA